MGMTHELYEEAIRRYNVGDLDGFAEAHAEDATLVVPVGTLRGRTAIREYWAAQRSAFPDLTLTVEVVVEQADTLASEWNWHGTNTGPLTLRDGARVPGTGKRVELRGMELVRVREGEIVDYRMYWDGMAIAAQLGFLQDSMAG